FRFTHRALESQQEPIIKMGRIIETLLIEDERVSERTDFQQPMPITRVAGQARDFQSDHQAGTAKAHLTHEFLETFTVRVRRQSGGVSQVSVDKHDAIGMPAERNGALPESVLALGALGVFQN